MPIEIRAANLEWDRSAMIEAAARNLTPDSDGPRFDWLYRDSPCGAAKAWLAIEKECGQVIGMAAAFPRKLWRGSDQFSGFVLGDFCVNEKYRSLGPSIQLQKACLAGVCDADFFYDFPSPGMMAIYGRLGIRSTLDLSRWAKPLRARKKIEPLVKSKLAARGLGALVDVALAKRGWKGDAKACDLELQAGPCGEEFTEFDNRLSNRGVRTARTAGYLNWRYSLHTQSQHKLLAARKAGKLVGYVVYAVDPVDPSIVDVAAVEKPEVIARLLHGAVEDLRGAGAGTVSLYAGDNHPWNDVFQRAGFRKRESAPVIVDVRSGAGICRQDFQNEWSVMQGDRDS